jgi:polo-like kinase 2
VNTAYNSRKTQKWGRESEKGRSDKYSKTANDHPRNNLHSKHGIHMTNSKAPSALTEQENRKKGLAVVDVREVKMLAKATRVLQEHVKDMTEKTKSTCCVGKQIMKENLIYNNALPAPPVEPVNYISDQITGVTYIKGKLLGKGGFAKCYELTCVKTGKIYAGKVISKNRISKPHQKDKIAREVELHKNLRHAHVVGFHSYFEDNDNVYIILEICHRKSLVHVLRNRKTITEPEVRFYLKHLIDGTKYIHKQNIIHRDLKLGNMLLNESMNVKLADFGLATRVEYEGEKKMTVCGTPNYIAPEVLQKKGHSFEADIWAIGCVMYAMLVGRPPFETSTLKETYMRITSNKYHIPSHLSPSARHLIQKLLNPEPSLRPTLDKIIQDDFFTAGYMPKSLPTSCCDSAPKFTFITVSSRPKSYAAPVSPSDAMHKITSSLAHLKGSRRSTTPSPVRGVAKSAEDVRSPSSQYAPPAPPAAPVVAHHPEPMSTRTSSTPSVAAAPSDAHKRRSIATPVTIETKAMPYGSAVRLYQLLTTCIEQMPEDANPAPVHNVKPLWVTKWVDYSNKYGFGFQLSDKSVGVLFNDTTRMLLTADGKTIQYNDLSNKVYSFAADNTPREYRKKSTLLLYFAQYMDEHLIHGGDILHHRDVINEASCLFMKKWFRTQKAIVMYLNNGTLQVNFFEDHTKVILSPDGQDYLMTFINSSRQAVTFRLLQLRHFGCHPDIMERLTYARSMLESIINVEGEAV